MLGPLSGSLSGIKVFLKSVIAQKPWLRDPLVFRKKWDEDEYQLVDHGGGKRMCFAIIWDDGNVVPHPPIIRGLEITKNALIAAGHNGWSHTTLLRRFVNRVFCSSRLETVETCRTLCSDGECL